MFRKIVTDLLIYLDKIGKISYSPNRTLHVLQRLAGNGFDPQVCYDVGAFQGSFALECLQVWPSTQVFCFEPLEEKVVHLNELSKVHPSIQVVPGLVGAANKANVAFHEAENASSILQESVPQDFPVRDHPMRTLSSHAETIQKKPQFLKIDTQGYEFEVLKGAEELFDHIQVILFEASFLEIHQDVALFGEIHAWLTERSWVPYDLCEIKRRPLDSAIWTVDFVYVKENSPLRANKAWGN
ncbi:MAG: FkbM family methyltransferase [Magnetococcales bacterium]|nr:FkbM family methyltransferase [Magnetococcales bacterium]